MTGEVEITGKAAFCKVCGSWWQIENEEEPITLKCGHETEVTVIDILGNIRGGITAINLGKTLEEYLKWHTD